MKSELEALQASNTWTIVDLPNGKTPIGRNWVYKVYISLPPDLSSPLSNTSPVSKACKLKEIYSSKTPYDNSVKIR
ncbi:hypothetical protein MTR_1g090940 [Medicago truncatula]|uniref:Uncharacterized protein n=1 Tax=Medicago truncatula TaxID=3880 RepID=A0A072VNL6_MEDTR|nr:hypothetical protein MTR_1g090940 [Medicago truncatula]